MQQDQRTDRPATPDLPPPPNYPGGYAAHLRYLARLSVDLEPLNTPLPPSAASSRPSTPTAPRPASRQGYVPERMVYAPQPASPSPAITPVQGSSRPGSTYQSTTPTPSTPYLCYDTEAQKDVPVGPAHHHPPPQRVYLPSPSDRLHFRRPGEKIPKKHPGRCCGLCEVLAANRVGGMIGGWITGIGTFLLLRVAGCCAATMAGLGQ
ncbi:hypothetical protein NKR23_g739 [Pleurostoma richardsiae]|uniref:Uncharacterized protein n=1 Tax=Pleurostoma richardsiae TaxID=41990 RepID=A0AA38S6X5_9PEZI|nr:hypothetical protein NKR23_g739 [Pleurostoma richardsiae]